MSDRRCTLLVGLGTCGISVGAEQVYSSLEAEIARLNLRESIQIKPTGCHGFCQQEPLVVIEPEGIFYSKVEPDDISDIIQSLLPEGKPVERLFYRHPVTDKPIPYYRDIPFYNKQQRIVLRNCGNIALHPSAKLPVLQGLSLSQSRKKISMLTQISATGVEFAV